MVQAAEQADKWSEKDQQIQVSEGQGFLYNLKLRAKVEGTPGLVYSILTDPNAVSIYRSIKACTYRTVLEEDKSKRTRKLEVGHRALARFLFISITFETRLFVWEDDVRRSIHFCNAHEGFMKKFEGSWNVQPFTPQALQGGPEARRSHLNPLAMLQSKLGLHHQHQGAPAALVSLEQAILPKLPAPPGIKGMLRRLCAKQIRDMMEDLRLEVDRRKGKEGPAAKGKEGPASKGKEGPASKTGSRAAAANTPAASLTLAQPGDIWEHAAPFNLTIKL